MSSYFQASYCSGILRISGIADLQHWIFLNISDIILMFLEESGVVFPFPEKKSAMVASPYLCIFMKASEKILREFHFFINLKKFRGCVGYWLVVRARRLVDA